MVWDTLVDKRDHLSKCAVMLILLDPAKAMSPRGETIVDLEAELLLKTKDYSWKSIALLLNIPMVMKNMN